MSRKNDNEVRPQNIEEHAKKLNELFSGKTFSFLKEQGEKSQNMPQITVEMIKVEKKGSSIYGLILVPTKGEEIELCSVHKDGIMGSIASINFFQNGFVVRTIEVGEPSLKKIFTEE